RSGTARLLVEKSFESIKAFRLDERRGVEGAGDNQKLAARQCLYHPPGLLLRDDVAFVAPDDQGRALERREHRPGVRTRGRTGGDALGDVLGVELPAPAAVR